MPRPAQLEQVTFIVLRFMRAPILVVIVVYAVSIGGMVMMPGPVVDGEVTHIGFFHAFYFLTYTATTTGFGEIPHDFSDAQRMWAIVSLYMSVIAPSSSWSRTRASSRPWRSGASCARWPASTNPS